MLFMFSKQNMPKHSKLRNHCKLMFLDITHIHEKLNIFIGILYTVAAIGTPWGYYHDIYQMYIPGEDITQV